MKYKTTKAAVMNGYNNVIVGYCLLQSLLSYYDAEAYTSGVYGHNADIYRVGRSTAIVTGSRPFGNIRIPYSVVSKYENEANAIDYHIDYQKRKEIAADIMDRFLQEVKGETA